MAVSLLQGCSSSNGSSASIASVKDNDQESSVENSSASVTFSDNSIQEEATSGFDPSILEDYFSTTAVDESYFRFFYNGKLYYGRLLSSLNTCFDDYKDVTAIGSINGLKKVLPDHELEITDNLGLFNAGDEVYLAENDSYGLCLLKRNPISHGNAICIADCKVYEGLPEGISENALNDHTAEDGTLCWENPFIRIVINDTAYEGMLCAEKIMNKSDFTEISEPVQLYGFDNYPGIGKGETDYPSGVRVASHPDFNMCLICDASEEDMVNVIAVSCRQFGYPTEDEFGSFDETR